MTPNPDQARVVIIDMQERLRPAIPDFDAIGATIARLIACATALSLPVVATEHCRQALGPTVADLAAKLDADAVLHKRRFSAAEVLDGAGGSRRQTILSGVEAHACVMQTALALLTTGQSVFVVADAVASRRESDKALALRRIEAAGGVIVSFEMLALELLGGADHPQFKAILSLIR